MEAVMEIRMDRLSQFLVDIRRNGLAAGQFRGLLNVLIGRRIEADDGTVVSKGLTWREAAALLKKHRFDKNLAQELEIDTRLLPPRQREKYWYAAIGMGQIDSPLARLQGDQIAKAAKALGYTIGPAPFA